MKWKEFLSYKHARFCRHHQYQMEVIFLFVSGFFLFFPFYLIVDELNHDLHIWQWYFFIPWMVFYISYSLLVRSKIPKTERISLLRKPLAHWVLLGVSLIALHSEPSSLEQLQALDVSFGVFSLFLADSYWDFREIKLFS